MTETVSAERKTFSTAEASGSGKWDVWSEFIAPLFEVEKKHEADQVHAEIDAFELPSMLLAKMTLSGSGHTGRRSKGLIGRTGIDHYAIEFCLRSEGHFVEGRHGVVAIPSGGVSVLDLAQPNVSAAVDTAAVTLTVPRAELDRRCAAAEDMHGSCLVGDGLSRLLGDHLLSLYRRMPEMSADEAGTGAEATLAFVAACLRPSRDRLAEAGGVINRTLFERAARHIERKLCDPDLSVSGVCAAAGVSRSGLYRLFQPSGGVAHYIQERRLRRAHAALRDPAEWRSVSEIAYALGFVSTAHFSRRFRSLYGCSPSDIRGLARRRGPPAASGGGNSVAAWLSGLPAL